MALRLVLVDVDNVLGYGNDPRALGRQFAAFPGTALPLPISPPVLEGRDVALVVYALNTQTARTRELDAWIETATPAFGWRAGCARADSYVVVAPPIPEAADAALARCALERTNRAPEPEVGDVFLFSRDERFARALAKRLGQKWPRGKAPWWRLARKPYRRTVAPQGGENPVTGLEELPSSTEERLDWLASRPGLWSVLAPTWGAGGSLHGVERWSRGDAPDVDATVEADLRTTSATGPSNGRATPLASRFGVRWGDAAVRTSLPTAFLARDELDLDAACFARGELRDPMALRAMEGVELELPVRLDARGNNPVRVRATIERPVEALPEAWWHLDGSGCEYHQVIHARCSGVVGSFVVAAVARVVGSASISIRPRRCEGDLEVLEDIPAHWIGPAVDAAGTSHALYADRPLERGELVAAVPIRSRREHPLSRLLRHLPVHVLSDPAGPRVPGTSGIQ